MKFSGTFKLHDVEFEISGLLHKGDPGKMYLSNGDPGYPPEGDTPEIENVTCGDQDFTAFADNYNLWDDLHSAILEQLE